MKLLQELLQLNESVTFSVAVLDGDTYRSDKFETEKKVDCWACEGSGKDEYDKSTDCDLCHGSGKLTEWETEYKQLNVANGNFSAIMDMLGLHDEESCGGWQHKELPGIKRKLIALKNKDKEQYTADWKDEQGPARAVKDEDGNHRITRGPRMMGGERTLRQVENYIDTLLAMVDYAQKHEACVVWA